MEEQGAERQHIAFRAGGEGEDRRRRAFPQGHAGRLQASQADQAGQGDPGIDVAAGRIEIECPPTAGFELQQFVDEVRLFLGEVPGDGDFPTLAAAGGLGIVVEGRSMGSGMWFHVGEALAPGGRRWENGSAAEHLAAARAEWHGSDRQSDRRSRGVQLTSGCQAVRRFTPDDFSRFSGAGASGEVGRFHPFKK